MLREDIKEGVDFVLVHITVWRLFAAWYGGGPAIFRPSVLNNDVWKVRMYSLLYSLIEYDSLPYRTTLVDNSILSHMPDLTCCICYDVLFDPSETKCRHSFCTKCIAAATTGTSSPRIVPRGFNLV